MSEQITARVQLKIDTEANWKKNAPTFVPRAGELIIYNPDANHSVPRFKVGDGENYLLSLPFSNDELIMKNGDSDYWLNNSNYIPKAGEIVVINADNAGEVASIKIGDGETNFENLPIFGGDSAGDSTTAQKLVNSAGTAYNVGDPNNLVYFSNGIPIASDIYVWKTVPTNAEFTDTKYTTATTSKEGLMSAEDKTALDNLKNKAVLNTQTASSSQFGIVKLGSNLTELNGVVSVPEATTTTAGVISAADKVKLDKLENVQSDWNATSGAAAILNKPTIPTTAEEVGAIPNTTKVATLGEDGFILSSQLPSYVDEIIEVENSSSFPAVGEGGKIYVTIDDRKTYRWSGSEYVEISASLTLGDTEFTAYRGDLGALAYAHATATTGAAAHEIGFYKVRTNAEGHVIGAEKVVKADITSLGIPGSDTTYSEFTGATAGLVPTSTGEEDKYLAADGEWKIITVPEINYPVTSVNGHIGEVQLTAADVGALSDDTVIPEAITVDNNLTSTGTNPVQGKAIYTALAGKQDAGDYALKTDIPTIPVTSVNGKTGAVQLTIPTALSELTQTTSYRTVSDTEKSTWNSKGTGTITGVTAGNGLSGGGISGSVTLNLATSGVTATSYGPSSNASPDHAGTFKVPYITVDSYGRITSASTKTITLPAAPTSVTMATFAQTALAWNGGKGAVNQPIYFDSDGEAQTCNTIPSYSTFTTSSSGLVPAPGSSNTSKFLRGDGTWQTVSIDTSSFVTTSSLNTTLGSYVTSSSLSTTLSSYAKTSTLTNYVPTTRTINGVSLSSNLTRSDIGANKCFIDSTSTGPTSGMITGDIWIKI